MKQLAVSVNGTSIPAPSGIPNGGFDTSGVGIIQVALSLLFVLAGVLAIIFIIVGGIQWITSGGDKQKIQQARLRITFAVVGLIVTFLAFFIIKIVFGLLGI